MWSKKLLSTIHGENKRWLSEKEIGTIISLMTISGKISVKFTFQKKNHLQMILFSFLQHLNQDLI